MPRKAAAQVTRITPKDLIKDAHLHADGKRCGMGYAIEVKPETAAFLIEKDLAYPAPDGMEEFVDEQMSKLPASFMSHAELANDEESVSA